MTREEARADLMLAQADISYRPKDDSIDMAIEALKSQKIGHWESHPYEHIGDDCSVCGARWTNTKVYKYCPSCGAKMVAVQGW